MESIWRKKMKAARKIGMTILFKGKKHLITDLCQCGTTKLSVWVDGKNTNDPYFRRWLLNKKIEIV